MYVCMLHLNNVCMYEMQYTDDSDLSQLVTAFLKMYWKY